MINDPIEYIKKSSEKFVSISQKDYNNFLKNFEYLSDESKNKSIIKDWFNRICTDVGDYLFNMNKILREIKKSNI